jgi:hypothetical protein
MQHPTAAQPQTIWSMKTGWHAGRASQSARFTADEQPPELVASGTVIASVCEPASGSGAHAQAASMSSHVPLAEHLYPPPQQMPPP